MNVRTMVFKCSDPYTYPYAKVSYEVQHDITLCMASGFTISFPRMVINASAYHLNCHSIVLLKLGAMALWFFIKPYL
jgi:hypothetical protein